MLGPRLKKAREVAARRAQRLAVEEPTISDSERHRVPPPSKEERQHRDPRAIAGDAHLRKWNGSCSCSSCRNAKAKRYKGEGKRYRATVLELMELDNTDDE